MHTCRINPNEECYRCETHWFCVYCEEEHLTVEHGGMDWCPLHIGIKAGEL
jgi:hypothetical protein